MTNATLKTWSIEGRDEDGTAETTQIEVALNPEWTAETADTESRYFVTATIIESDIITEDEGFDTRGEAMEFARNVAKEAKSAYAERESERRETIVSNLEDVLENAAEGSDEAALIEAVANLITRNKAGAALAALKAAGLA